LVDFLRGLPTNHDTQSVPPASGRNRYAPGCLPDLELRPGGRNNFIRGGHAGRPPGKPVKSSHSTPKRHGLYRSCGRPGWIPGKKPVRQQDAAPPPRDNWRTRPDS